jgi:hypothetical protein
MKDEPTQKHTLHLYVGDFDRLHELHPDISASLIIRKLVRKHIDEHSPKPTKVGVINL